METQTGEGGGLKRVRGRTQTGEGGETQMGEGGETQTGEGGVGTRSGMPARSVLRMRLIT